MDIRLHKLFLCGCIQHYMNHIRTLTKFKSYWAHEKDWITQNVVQSFYLRPAQSERALSRAKGETQRPPIEM